MKKFYCVKDNDEKLYGYIDYSKMDGFKIKPKNKVKYDGVKVEKLLLIHPNFIRIIIRKKTTKRINSYLNYLLNILNSDEDTDPEDLGLILEDTVKYKSVIINKYSKYMRTEDIMDLIAKIGFIEEELKEKISNYNFNYVYENSFRGKGR